MSPTTPHPVSLILFFIYDYLSMYVYFSNRRKTDHWGDLGVDGWIILGWISRRWDVGIWTGLG